MLTIKRRITDYTDFRITRISVLSRNNYVGDDLQSLTSLTFQSLDRLYI